MATQSLQYKSALQNLLPIFFQNAPLTRMAYKDVADSYTPARKGKTVVLNRPNMNQFAAASITAAAYGSGNQGDLTLAETVTLDQHYGVNFVATDIEWAQMGWEGRIPQTARLAVEALARNVETAIVNKAVVSAYQQVTKTSDALYDLAAINDKFAENGVAVGRRLLAVPAMLHFTSNANLLHSSIAGGNLNGFRFENALLPVEYCHALSGVSFTDGTSDSLYQAAGVNAVGSTSVLLDTEGSGTMKEGDIITFAGHTGNYVVTTGITAHSQTVYFYPGLRAATAGNEVISLTATTAASLGVAVHEMAMAVAFRPEEINPAIRNTVFFEQATDPATGLTLNYEILREYKQDRHILSVLYGVGKCLQEGVVKYKIS